MLDPLPCKDGSLWKPDPMYESFLRERFINLDQEWRRMELWLVSNDSRRKTRRGMKAFVGRWMAKSGSIRPKTQRIEGWKPVDKSIARDHIGRIKEIIR